MCNVVFLGKMGKHFDEGGPIVRDNLNKGIPPTEDVLKDLVSKGGTGFILEFWIM